MYVANDACVTGTKRKYDAWHIHLTVVSSFKWIIYKPAQPMDEYYKSFLMTN